MVNRGGKIIMRKTLHISVSSEELNSVDKIISATKKEGYELHDLYPSDRRFPESFVSLVFDFVGLKENKGKKK